MQRLAIVAAVVLLVLSGCTKVEEAELDSYSFSQYRYVGYITVKVKHPFFNESKYFRPWGSIVRKEGLGGGMVVTITGSAPKIVFGEHRFSGWICDRDRTNPMLILTRPKYGYTDILKLPPPTSM